jgi:hypothetical protein
MKSILLTVVVILFGLTFFFYRRRLKLAVLVTGGLYLVVTAVRLFVLREDVDRLTSLGLVVGSLVAVWASVNVVTGLLERRRSRAGR